MEAWSALPHDQTCYVINESILDEVLVKLYFKNSAQALPYAKLLKIDETIGHCLHFTGNESIFC